MTSTSTQYHPTIGLTNGVWDEEGHVGLNQATLTNNTKYNCDQGALEGIKISNNISDKLQRRLAQNREAARKSRLKRKAYVRELESGRLKLAKLEHQIHTTPQAQQGAHNYNYVDILNTVHGSVAFETKYELWVVNQQRKESELVSILQTDVTDGKLGVFVEAVVNHYHDLFRLKADAAKTDAFKLLYGSWRSPVERLFQWLGGFRPSEVLCILMPWFEPLVDTQVVNLSKLRHTCRQAEDALTQGIDKLEQTLAHNMADNLTEAGSCDVQMRLAMEGLEALENFLNQADHLRHRTLQQMCRILTGRQAGRGLVALGEYFHRLRLLNSLWLARPMHMLHSHNAFS